MLGKQGRDSRIMYVKKGCFDLKQRKTKVVIIIVASVIVTALLIVLGILLFGKITSNDTSNSTSSSDLSKIKVGDTVHWGKYEQDNDESNGPESIEWQVINVKNDKALIVSKSVLDCKMYNEDDSKINWSDSSLRKWLNSDFYESAFSDNEKSSISLTDVVNKGTYEGYDKSGNWLMSNTKSNLETVVAESSDQENTQDHLFLLSIDEVNQFFTSKDNRKAFLSDYGTEAFIELGIEQAKKQSNVNEETIRTYYENSAKQYGRGFCNWWLRSPGLTQGCATAVDYEGTPGQSMTVTTNDGGVRPAMWLVIQ